MDKSGEGKEGSEEVVSLFFPSLEYPSKKWGGAMWNFIHACQNTMTRDVDPDHFNGSESLVSN